MTVNYPESVWCRELYEAKGAVFLLYGRALGLSHSEAEDALHDVFAALMRLKEPPLQPDNYCLRAIRNRVFSYRRNLWRRIKAELESHRWFDRAPGETAAERAAMRCLARLPVLQREVIVLKIWHRLTFEEIGELLELSPNTAAGRYRYGIEKLKACLTHLDYEEMELDRRAIAVLGSTGTIAES